jgi:hypothetical protein
MHSIWNSFLFLSSHARESVKKRVKRTSSLLNDYASSSTTQRNIRWCGRRAAPLPRTCSRKTTHTHRQTYTGKKKNAQICLSGRAAMRHTTLKKKKKDEDVNTHTHTHARRNAVLHIKEGEKRTLKWPHIIHQRTGRGGGARIHTESIIIVKKKLRESRAFTAQLLT